MWSTEGDGRQRMTVTEAGPLHGDERDEETREPRSVRGVKRPRRIWILQITVYYKELLTINCQGTNHPRSILSFMDISILYPNL